MDHPPDAANGTIAGGLEAAVGQIPRTGPNDSRHRPGRVPHLLLAADRNGRCPEAHCHKHRSGVVAGKAVSGSSPGLPGNSQYSCSLSGSLTPGTLPPFAVSKRGMDTCVVTGFLGSPPGPLHVIRALMLLIQATGFGAMAMQRLWKFHLQAETTATSDPPPFQLAVFWRQAAVKPSATGWRTTEFADRAFNGHGQNSHRDRPSQPDRQRSWRRERWP